MNPQETFLQMKKDFPVLTTQPTLAYLDNAASSQTPHDVLRAMDNYYRTKRANVHRGVYKLSESATVVYEEARATIARFLHAEPREIVFTKSTTEALNVASMSLARDLQPGDEIIISAMEHHANLVPWQQRAKERGLKLRIIPLTDTQELDMNAFASLVTNRTRIVAVTWISNALGVVNPIEDIIARAHAVGARVVIDAAQAVGHVPIDVRALDADLLAFSGHKMFGPTGIGVLFGKAELLEKMEPVLFGGDMIREVTMEAATWNDIPYKFEAGTPPIAEAIGLAAAVDYITAHDLIRMSQTERQLAAYTYAKLSALPGVHLFGPRGMVNRSNIFSFTVDGVHPHDLATIMDERGIAIRAGHHCAMPLMTVLGVAATARISLHIYNTREDIDRVCDAICDAQKLFNSRS